MKHTVTPETRGRGTTGDIVAGHQRVPVGGLSPESGTTSASR